MRGVRYAVACLPLIALLAGCAPPTPMPEPHAFDGMYNGAAYPLITDAGMCLSPIEGVKVQVAGDQVSAQILVSQWSVEHFEGSIDGAGYLQMVDGIDWIIVRFTPTAFEGQFLGHGRRGHQACVFALSLARHPG
jgi:hypothetical protein